MFYGNRLAGDTIDFKFSTDVAGTPTTLAGSPAVLVYKDNSTTESTSTGITLTVDFDSRTGLNHVRITTASDGTFYANGSDFTVVITAGTVGGISVVGYVVGHFSLANRPELRPTTAGRTLDVSATGEAGLDWANIGSPTTAQNLSATTIATVTNGVTLAASAVQAIWDALTAALTTAGSIGKLLVDNINATISSRLASASITLSGGAVTVGTNNDKTGYAIGAGGIGSTAFAAGAIDAAAIAADAIGSSELAQSAAQEVADEVLNRDLVGGSSGNTRNVRNALRVLRNKVSESAGTLTVYQEDDATSAWTASTTRTAGADPLTAVDPA